jgi:HD-GYP domain-containing protein (c-di-GMP phosphodiesterase class II)
VSNQQAYPSLKSISDFFEVDFEVIRAGKRIPFSIHLFFPRNSHIMLWRKAGETPSEAFLDKYRKRGIEKVWVLLKEKERFEEYLKAEELAPILPFPTVSANPEEASKLVELIENPEIDEKRKTAMIAKAARELLTSAAEAETVGVLAEKNSAICQSVHEVVKSLEKTEGIPNTPLVSELWVLSDSDPLLVHGVLVAAYTVLFALAFGIIDPVILSELAYAGLLHDTGISQIPCEASRVPMRLQRNPDHKLFEGHVGQSVLLLERFAPSISPKIRTLIQQHHEKFDGSGFPKGLQGFEIKDLSEILAIADTLVGITSGQWDGASRTLAETLAVLESLEKSRNFPEFFNPDVFGTALKWLCDPKSEKAARLSEQFASSKLREVLSG